MLVKEVMRKDVITTEPETLIKEAAQVMMDNQIGSLIVVRKNIVKGILTEHDVMKAVAGGLDVKNGEVSIAMTPYVYTVTPNQKLNSAISTMRKNNIKKLPVMYGRKLIGIITATDIVISFPELINSLKSVIK